MCICLGTPRIVSTSVFAPEYLGVIQLCSHGVIEAMVVAYTSLYAAVAKDTDAKQATSMEFVENWFRCLTQEKACFGSSSTQNQ